MISFERAILQMLKLDDNKLTKLTVVMESNKPPLVVAEMLLFEGNTLILLNDEIATVTKQYELKEIEQ